VVAPSVIVNDILFVWIMALVRAEPSLRAVWLACVMALPFELVEQ